MSFRHIFEHRDRLLEAAIATFVDKGYEGASLSTILAEAGMSKGQFYHHFGGKEALYLAVCEALIDRKAAWFADHPPPTADDPFDALEAALRAGLDFARANPEIEAFGRAFLRERGRAIFDTAVRTFPLTVDPTLAAALRRGWSTGAFANDVSPGFATRAIGVVLAAAPDLIDGDDPGVGVDEIVRFLRRGLGRT